MSTQFAKPENALRKARDLVATGKPIPALKGLHNILTIKRYRQWTPTHEQIMKLYVELAVPNRQSAKDAFIQYRAICHEAQVGSLELLLREYVTQSEAKAAAALAETQKNLKSAAGTPSATPTAAAAAAAAGAGDGKDQKALALVLSDVKDLEAEDSPESLLLQSVSGEDSKARADRQILTPWLKYLWEAYRTALDVLKNNQKLERVYHVTARSAFLFCKTYRRTQEFRRLCEMLRTHLGLVEKYQHQNHPNQIDPNNPDTQRLYLETRFEQLRVASDLELWQEAYRSIEDIYQNMRLSAVPPSPALMATYYDKLTQIFWASENSLFHAYSLSKYYSLLSQQTQQSQQGGAAAAAAAAAVGDVKEFAKEQRSRMATAVLLATLTIPLEGRYSSHGSLELEDVMVEENEGNLRLADLLGFKRETPTRARLIAGHSSSGVLNDVSEDGKHVYQLLEKKFGPLSLGSQLYPLFDKFEKDELLGKYVPLLKQLTVIRLLQQLATVFKTMRFDKFYRLAPPNMSPAAIEQLIMTSVKQGQVHVRVDHRSQMFVFVDDTFESARLRNQLSVLAERLQTVVNQIQPVLATDKEYERQSVFKDVKLSLDREHAEVFERIRVVERRKAQTEEADREKQREAAEAQARAVRERELIARRQMEEELKQRKAKEAKAEQEANEKAARDAAAAALEKKVRDMQAKAEGTRATAAFNRVQKEIDAATDKNALMKMAHDLAIKEREEKERKLREQWKRLDYFTRASRAEEVDTLIALEAKRKAEDAKAVEEAYQKRVQEQKALHVRALAEKARLLKIVPQKKLFHAQLMARRTAEFKVASAEQQKRLKALAEQRAKEAAERAAQEEEERRKQEEEEEERRKQEEEEQAELARKAEEKLKKEKEAEERRARLDAIAAKQRQREAELEAAEAAKRGGTKPAARGAAPARKAEEDAPQGEGEDAGEGETGAADAGEGEDAAAAAAGDEGEAAAAGDEGEDAGAEGEDAAPAKAAPAKAAAPAARPAPAAGANDRWRRNDDAAPRAGGPPAARPGSAAPAAGKWQRGGAAGGAAGGRFGRGDDAAPAGGSRFGRAGDDDAPRAGMGARGAPRGGAAGAAGDRFGDRPARPAVGASGGGDNDRWRRRDDDGAARPAFGASRGGAAGAGRGGFGSGFGRGGAAAGGPSRFRREDDGGDAEAAPAPAPAAKPSPAKPAAPAAAAADDGFQTVQRKKPVRK